MILSTDVMEINRTKKKTGYNFVFGLSECKVAGFKCLKIQEFILESYKIDTNCRVRLAGSTSVFELSASGLFTSRKLAIEEGLKKIEYHKFYTNWHADITLV